LASCGTDFLLANRPNFGEDHKFRGHYNFSLVQQAFGLLDEAISAERRICLMTSLRFLFPSLVVLAAPFLPPKSEDFPQVVRVFGCEMVRNKKVVVLKAPEGDRSHILTTKEYAPPFAIRIKAKTDSKNLRLYYNAGVVIFNWEGNENELRIHDPATGEQMGVEGKGYIEPNKWHDITWEVYPDGMRVLLKGEELARKHGDYAKLKASVGIGPAFGSVISVESFRIEALKGKLPEKK
jgi:hypothetical protein